MPYSPDFTDKEVIHIMVDGAQKLCDHAISLWSSDNYGMGHEVSWQHIQRWKAIRERVSVLANRLKAEKP